MCFQQAKRAGLGWPGGCRPAGSPDLWSGPSARARAWNGRPGFRDREKASDWVQAGLDLSLGKHPMTNILTPSLLDTSPNFRINGAALPIVASTVQPYRSSPRRRRPALLLQCRETRLLRLHTDCELAHGKRKQADVRFPDWRTRASATPGSIDPMQPADSLSRAATG